MRNNGPAFKGRPVGGILLPAPFQEVSHLFQTLCLHQVYFLTRRSVPFWDPQGHEIVISRYMSIKTRVQKAQMSVLLVKIKHDYKYN